MEPAMRAQSVRAEHAAVGHAVMLQAIACEQQLELAMEPAMRAQSVRATKHHQCAVARGGYCLRVDLRPSVVGDACRVLPAEFAPAGDSIAGAPAKERRDCKSAD
jgi:hypothetical protein